MNEKIVGKIHKIESFGTLDGPGIRTVIFLTGCDKRCIYCHNPDTWTHAGAVMALTPSQLLEKVKRYKPYYGKTGGVTLSGGEPLIQSEFAREFFALCKSENIHTVIDTSGMPISKKIKDVLKYTDMVLLDIKMPDEIRYQEYIGYKLSTVLEFLDYLCEQNIETIVRYVVVPTINDAVEDLRKIISFVKGKTCVKDIELLPFHQMGKEKYENLKIEYKLADLEVPSRELMDTLKVFKAKEL